MRIVLQFAVFIGFLLLFFALTSDLSVVFADTPLESTLKSTNSALQIFISLVRTLTAIAVALSFFYFFWNIALYIKSPGNKDEIRNKLVAGVVAITIATSIWGIVAFIRGTLGITNEPPSPLLLPPLQLTEIRIKTRTITVSKLRTENTDSSGLDTDKCTKACKECKTKDGSSLDCASAQGSGGFCDSSANDVGGKELICPGTEKDS